MRSFLLLITCLLLTTYGFTQNQPLYDQLYEVNEQWGNQPIDPDDYQAKVNFSSDDERIQAHLLLVADNLASRNTDHLTLHQATHRKELLAQLSNYAVSGKFPRNTNHAIRIPYFIDDFGTPCAVGHLLFESGFGEFAEQVRQESNNAYVLDMNYPELPTWAAAHGFTVDELAWIQPSYPSPHTLAPFQGGGTNGVVREILVDEANEVVYFAGDFSQAGTRAVNSIAIYDATNGSWLGVGSGIDGEVFTLEFFEGDLYAGGSFASGNNLGVWDGLQWTFSKVYDGTIYDLHVHDGTLYAGGDITHSGGMHVQHVLQLSNGIWMSVGQGFDAPVYSFASFNGQLYAGGEFENTLNAVITPFVAVWNGTAWAAVDSGGPAAPVKDLHAEGNTLYAGGHFQDSQSMPVFGLNSYSNGVWTGLCNDTYNTGPYVIEDVFVYNGHVCFGGDVNIGSGLAFYYGRNVGYYTNGAGSNMFPIGAPDSTVFTMAELNGNLIMGGNMSNNYGSGSYQNLMETILMVGLEKEKEKEWVHVAPNPVQDEFRVILPESFAGKTLEIKGYNIAGQEIKLNKIRSNGNEISFKRGSSPAGLYFLRFFASGEEVGSTNLVFE